MGTNHPLASFRQRHTPPLSQLELAKLLQVGAPAISRWENGSRKIDVDVLPKIVELTGIPASELRPDLAKLFSEDGP